jgi:hypothetical protein
MGYFTRPLINSTAAQEDMMWQPKPVHRWLPGLALALVLLTGTANLRAQATGTMSGFVKDSSGAFVPQASITATLVSRQATFKAETNSEGFYNLPALEPGAYILRVEKPGFKAYAQGGLTLTVGRTCAWTQCCKSVL